MTGIALVTGAAGFVGRHLMSALGKDHYIYAIDPKYKPEGWAWGSYWRERFENLTSYALFPEFDVVVHLAANIQSIDRRMGIGIEPFQDIESDWKMAQYIEAHPPKKAFVYMSSCAVDSKEEDPYGWVKATGEKVFKRLYAMGVPVVILRPFSGYGVDQDESYPFPAILKRVLSGQNPVKIWGSGYQVRDWIHIDDLVRGILWAIDHAPRGVPIDIGTGVGTEMFALAKMMAKLAFPDKQIEIEADGDKPESSHSRIAQHFITQALGFEARISLEEGVRTTIEQLRAKDVAASAA